MGGEVCWREFNQDDDEPWSMGRDVLMCPTLLRDQGVSSA